MLFAWLISSFAPCHFVPLKWTLTLCCSSHASQTRLALHRQIQQWREEWGRNDRSSTLLWRLICSWHSQVNRPERAHFPRAMLLFYSSYQLSAYLDFKRWLWAIWPELPATMHHGVCCSKTNLQRKFRETSFS